MFRAFRGSVLFVAVALLTVASASPQAAAPAEGISNPDLFEKSLTAAHQALGYYGSYDELEPQRRINRIGYEVAQQSDFQAFPFSFFVVDMPVPNAFALPGGHIFITRGMLDLDLTDDMLAGLLGHEIAHVVYQHGMKMQKRARLLNALSQVVLVGVMVTADTSGRRGPPSSVAGDPRYGGGGGDRVMGAAAAGMVLSELLLRSYSRNFEDEADDEGQRMAAAAGYDPDGTRALMSLMQVRLPQTQEYGYWQTHPFFEDRVRAGTVRAELLKIQAPESADAYRRRTQATLLKFTERKKLEPELVDLLKFSAVVSWPSGPESAAIRLDFLHRRRDREFAKAELARDFGGIIEDYKREADEVSSIEPEAPVLDTFAEEIAGFRKERDLLYPKAQEVYQAGVFETGFLETFVSNYQDAPEFPDVALQLGNAYSRLRRSAEAVEQYLSVWERAPDSEAGLRARTGLKTLSGVLIQLDALQKLVDQDLDPELRSLAIDRIDSVVASFEELSNGATYLKAYPDATHARRVNERLNSLAEDIYGEVILYQTVGDHANALVGIQKILTDAPLSPAAERLRQRADLEG